MRGLFVVVAGLVLSGCATVITGTKSETLVQSEPPGARIYVNGEYKGEAPVSLNLSRKRDYQVVAKMEGFRPTNASLERSFNSVALVNLACLACWAVDAGTGAMWQFDSESLTIELEAEPDEKPEPVAFTPAPRARKTKVSSR